MNVAMSAPPPSTSRRSGTQLVSTHSSTERTSDERVTSRKAGTETAYDPNLCVPSSCQFRGGSSGSRGQVSVSW
jgi:hypothetical protein